jgi:hypothetical protein
LWDRPQDVRFCAGYVPVPGVCNIWHSNFETKCEIIKAEIGTFIFVFQHANKGTRQWLR